MQQETNSATYGTQLYKVKYRTVELQTAPAFTATSLGTLKRGAVVTILNDAETYHYKVRLDNGLEGYVYKAAGAVISGLNPTAMPELTIKPAENHRNGTSNGVVSNNGSSNGFFSGTDSTDYLITNKNGNGSGRKTERYTPSRNGSSNGFEADSSAMTFGNLSSGHSNSTTRAVKIITGEIAALDKPGIVGHQIAKLRRGDVATVLSEDSFFYEVALPNGQVGFIPHYAAEVTR